MSGVREENVEDVECEVCDVRCAPQEFFDHLISKTHVRRSGGGVLNWSEESKSRSMMVFSSFSLVGSKAAGEEGNQDKTGVVALLQKCSRGGRSVVNFVGWEENPKLGVVQFGTKKMAEMFMKEIQKGQENLKKPGELRMDDDHVVEVQLLSDLGNLQLAILIPKCDENFLPFRQTAEVNTSRDPSLLGVEENELEDTLEEIVKLEDEMDDDDDDVLGGAVVVTLEDSLNTMEVDQIEDEAHVEQESQDEELLSDDNIVEGGAESQGGSQAAKKSKSRNRSRNQTANQTTKNPAKILKRVVQQQGWNELSYSSSYNPVTEKFTFRVALGNCVFTPGFGSSTEKEAKQNAVEHCLKSLQARGVQSDSFVGKLNYQDSIQYQYLCIQNVVGIADGEYRNAMEVVTVIKSVYSSTDPTAQVMLYDSWTLKLKDPLVERPEPVIFVGTRKPHPKFPESFVAGSNAYTAHEVGSRGQYTQTGMTFRLLSDQEYLKKAWMSRMVEYLCTFDSRCQPLLTLLYHWAITNSELLNQPKFLMEPVTLQWMVVFSLSFSGQVIPSAGQLMKRCFVRSSGHVREGKVPDVFQEDEEFHQTWIKRKAATYETGDEFIIAVLKLLHGFLRFYGVRVARGNYILQTRDGRLFDLEGIRTRSPSNMTWKDRDKLLSSEWIRAALKETGNRKRAKVGIYLSDPFDVECSLPLPENIYRLFRIMKVTADRLRTFLASLSDGGMKKTRDRLGTLQKILKIWEMDL